MFIVHILIFYIIFLFFITIGKISHKYNNCTYKIIGDIAFNIDHLQHLLSVSISAQPITYILQSFSSTSSSHLILGLTLFLFLYTLSSWFSLAYADHPVIHPRWPTHYICWNFINATMSSNINRLFLIFYS